MSQFIYNLRKRIEIDSKAKLIKFKNKLKALTLADILESINSVRKKLAIDLELIKLKLIYFKNKIKALTLSEILELITSACVILAEVSNIGIVIEIIAHWSPVLAAMIALGPVAYMALIADPLIYFFRALIRLTRFVGTTFFNVQFSDSTHLTPKEKLQQRIGDLFSLGFFVLAISLFAGVILPPVGITLAWTAGLCGLMIVGYTDHHLPHKGAKRHLAKLKDTDCSNEEISKASSYVKGLKNAKYLYIALLLGLTLLLICGSAAAFAPPLLVPALLAVSNGASIYLGIIAVGRFSCWIYNKIIRPKELSPKVIPVPVPNPEFTDFVPTPSHKKPKPKMENTHFPFNLFQPAPEEPIKIPIEIELELSSGFKY